MKFASKWLWLGCGVCVLGLAAVIWNAGQWRELRKVASQPLTATGRDRRPAGATTSPTAGTASAKGFALRQLPYGGATDADLGLPADWGSMQRRELPREIPGRRVPETVGFGELEAEGLTNFVVPLPEANTLAHLNFQERRFGRLVGEGGAVELFNPEVVLVKFRGLGRVGALRVEPMREWEAVQKLGRRADVQFAELDVFQKRQFSPNDPLLASQWHHGVIGSYQAWGKGLGLASVRVAILDTPFQMNHPDLAANTVSGWDAVTNGPVTSSDGIVHSTVCAGMAAAVINNLTGVAGAANCEVLPININGAISEMYNGTMWAASNGVRLVNISWTGGNSFTLEDAGLFLKTQARGILAMAGVNGTGYLGWTNQPDIYCISMTDAADNLQSLYGPHIDFAAPGWQIYSTTTGSGYDYGSGTSYATPLFCGVAAAVMSLNPTLGADEVIGILKSTAVDLGPAGWDQYFGWGRINYGAAAAAAMGTLPSVTGMVLTNGQAVVSVNYKAGLSYSLWRSTGLTPANWQLVTNAVVGTNGAVVTLVDPVAGGGMGFYRVGVAGQ